MNDDAVATLGEILQAWPETVAAPGWHELLPPGVSTLDVVEVAMDRWAQGLPTAYVSDVQETLLAVMGGDVDAAEASARARPDTSLGSAYTAVMSCAPDGSALLAQASGSLHRTWAYWALVVRQSRLDGRPDGRAERLLEIMTGSAPSSLPTDRFLNPLNENTAGGFSADVWGYRREPITWADDGLQLPDPGVGAARWLLEPREAVRDADLETALPRCV